MLQPTHKPIPTENANRRVRRLGRIHDDVIPVYFYEPVLEAILEYSEQNLRRELGGWLLGGLHRDDREYVEIRHFLPALHARSKATSLTFTHDTLSARDREVASGFPGEIVVGWHHTHPGLGVFFSGYDRFVHRHYFNSPWHVALVVDPKPHEFALYQWRGHEIVDCGFICVMKK